MPAPLAKGSGVRPPSSPRAPHAPPRSNRPLQTGLIIAASVIVAAGIAIYESPQVRQWVDQSRRKIAVALHSLGDEIQPRRPSESSGDFENRKRTREERIRRNRNELIKRAREEGIAVDLDELARIGREDVELAERRQRSKTNASQRSFDDLVGSDGMLKTDGETAQTATGTEASNSNLRKRGAAGFAAGSAAASFTSNPFSDHNIFFDRDDEEAPSPKAFTYVEPETRESSATIGAGSVSPPPAGHLIDITPDSTHLLPENIQTASIPQSEADEAEQAAQSFYSFTSSASHSEPQVLDDDEEAECISTGTLTPRSDHSHSVVTGASVVGSHADDIAILSMQNDSDHDARSETFSESGFTEASYSEIGEDRAGIMTPSSWTDVGSDDESEWGGPAQGGHVSQVHQ